jgi:opacity protein-like surface antigen|tara:strand:+ start:116269 stop:117063 length:795 start_codon:yes stop_codon:yes gene_type:complete
VKRTSLEYIILCLFICLSFPSFSGDKKIVFDAEARSQWFAFAAIGGQGPQFDSAIHVNNGSSFTAPYNQDNYAIYHDTFQPMVAVFAGKRWERDSAWIPAYSLGVRYESLFTTTVHGNISQYSLPEFTNYDYSWNIVSNLLFASAKVNLYQYKRFLPYVTAGLGGGFNCMSNYEEKALPGVTPRFTPGFQDNTQTQFAYHLGAGLDVQLTQGMLVSLAYQYLNLGHITSGYGTSTWSNQLLDLGSYRSNGLFLGATYLFPQRNT